MFIKRGIIIKLYTYICLTLLSYCKILEFKNSQMDDILQIIIKGTIELNNIDGIEVCTENITNYNY